MKQLSHLLMTVILRSFMWLCVTSIGDRGTAGSGGGWACDSCPQLRRFASPRGKPHYQHPNFTLYLPATWAKISRVCT